MYGVLSQLERQPFDYSEAYVYAYDRFDCSLLSRIRFENVVHAIGRKPTSVLDVGYANGAFLKECIAQGVMAYGLDVAPPDPPIPAVRVSHLRGFYDVITFFDSLEHMDDIGVVKDLDCNYVVISLPCLKDHDYTDAWFDSWKHRKPNEHLWFFTPTTLRSFMAKMGYACIGLSNVEDVVRKPTEPGWNILTGVFQKLPKTDA